jgi:cobalt-zinc-cadmium efflux system outer membrane protein
MAGVCVADDAVLPRLLDAPASPPVRRTHYTNPPIPVPASVRLAAAQQRVAIPKEKPQEFRLDLGESFPLAWTFDQVIAATLTSDPRLRIGKEDIRQAKAEYVTSSLIPNPEFSVEGAALPYGRSDHTGIPELNLTFEFPIDWFLFAKRKAEMKSARWEVHQAQAEYADLIRERILETATLFYDVLEAKALLMVAKQDIDLLIQLEEIAKRGVEAGSMPVVELRRISLELLQCRQELLKTEKELDILKTQLRAQFGCTDYDPTFDITGDLDAETDKDPMPLEVAFERARRSRPDIRALRMQINKAKADTVVEKRNAYPEVTAGIGHLQEYEPDPTYRGWGIGVTLTVPLFDRNQGNRMKAHSALAQSNHHYQAGIADLRAEIVEADRNFRIAHQRVHAISTEEIRLATEVRDMMIAAFKVGGRPLVDVLDAERSYRETVRMFITSRADYWRAMYIYKSVVGINSVNDVRAVGH